MKLLFDASVQLTWAIANTEAVLAGAGQIEPIHFWLGILKIVDVAIPEVLRQLGHDDEEVKAAMGVAHEILSYLEINPERAKLVRRSIRHSLRGSVTRSFPEKLPILHRSEAMREAFGKAAALAVEGGAQKVNAFHLTHAIFEMGLVTLADCETRKDHPRSSSARWDVDEDL